MHSLDLVILAGGKGSRIKSLLKGKPKPMATFNNKPFLEYIIQSYSKYRFKNIFILTGYKSNLISKKFQNKNYNCTIVKCLKEKKPMGTAGALYSLRKRINNFILVNGDTFLEIDLKNTVNLIEKFSSIELLAIGIGHDVIRYYKRAVKITDVHDLGDAMINQLTDLFSNKKNIH